MKGKLMKKIVALAMALLVLTPALVFSTLPVLAADVTGWGDDASGGNHDAVGAAVGLGSTDPRAIAASVINVILGFLGIIAVVIILLGGFKWMTGGGNEDKVGEAKKLITAGVIGLVIILASWGIATFVINGLLTATGTPAT
ncbi:MAG: pilin [Patescibacteria group bacterium]|nr:pilin [Patescibacteria group bacterium]